MTEKAIEAGNVLIPIADYIRMFKALECDEQIVRCETCQVWLDRDEAAITEDYTGCWKMATGQSADDSTCKSYRATTTILAALPPSPVDKVMDIDRAVYRSLDRIDAEADKWAIDIDLPILIKGLASIAGLSKAGPPAERQKLIDRWEANIDAMFRQTFMESFLISHYGYKDFRDAQESKLLDQLKAANSDLTIERNLKQTAIDLADRAHTRLLYYASAANAGKAELNGREMARQVWGAFAEFNEMDSPYLKEIRAKSNKIKQQEAVFFETDEIALHENDIQTQLKAAQSTIDAQQAQITALREAFEAERKSNPTNPTTTEE